MGAAVEEERCRLQGVRVMAPKWLTCARSALVATSTSSAGRIHDSAWQLMRTLDFFSPVCLTRLHRVLRVRVDGCELRFVRCAIRGFSLPVFRLLVFLGFQMSARAQCRDLPRVHHSPCLSRRLLVFPGEAEEVVYI